MWGCWAAWCCEGEVVQRVVSSRVGVVRTNLAGIWVWWVGAHHVGVWWELIWRISNPKRNLTIPLVHSPIVKRVLELVHRVALLKLAAMYCVWVIWDFFHAWRWRRLWMGIGWMSRRLVAAREERGGRSWAKIIQAEKENLFKWRNRLRKNFVCVATSKLRDKKQKFIILTCRWNCGGSLDFPQLKEGAGISGCSDGGWLAPDEQCAWSRGWGGREKYFCRWTGSDLKDFDGGARKWVVGVEAGDTRRGLARLLSTGWKPGTL